MGFWSSLGEDLLNGAANSATGGTAGTLLNIAKTAAPIVNDLVQQNKNNNQLQYAQTVASAPVQTSKDQLALNAKAELAKEQAQAASTAIDEEAAREKQQADAYAKARKSALAENVKDVNIDLSSLPGNVPTLHFTGGLRPSAYGPEGLAAAQTLNNQAMQQLTNPTTFPAVPTPSLYEQTQPTIPAPPTENFWEKLAGPLGFGLTALSTGHPGAATGTAGTPADTGVLRPPADTHVGATPVPTLPGTAAPTAPILPGIPSQMFQGPPVTIPPPVFDPYGGG
jgi:hypothetical protein